MPEREHCGNGEPHICHRWWRNFGDYGDVAYECPGSDEPHSCESCPTCGVHGGRHDKCCGCYDGVCCQESGDPSPSGPASQLERGSDAPSPNHKNGSER